MRNLLFLLRRQANVAAISSQCIPRRFHQLKPAYREFSEPNVNKYATVSTALAKRDLHTHVKDDPDSASAKTDVNCTFNILYAVVLFYNFINVLIIFFRRKLPTSKLFVACLAIFGLKTIQQLNAV